MKVGVLGLQGAIKEHISKLQNIAGIKAEIVKTKTDIETVEALIIPGGESTTIGKLINDFNLMSFLQEKIKNGLPVWGTCAGMILLAKDISNHEQPFLNVMDIKVRRNAYGGQLNSFKTHVNIPELSTQEIPLVFIRAPYVEKTWNDVEIISSLDEKIIACRQQNLLATSFHPELTNDLSFHNYFIERIVKNSDR